MKKDTYCTNRAQCPFYRAEKKQEILCEGVNSKSVIHLAFASPVDKKKYTEMFCNNLKNCDNCRLFDMLNLKHLMEDNKKE